MINIKQQIQLFIMNGMYVPFIHYFLYYFTNDVFLSTVISMKLYPANYFYWFEGSYNYLPHPYNALKQFVRFTDSGHIASYIYYFNPDFLPIAYNVHFIITFGYWIGKVLFDMKDSDCIENNNIIQWYERVWSCASHSVPYALFINEIVSQNKCYIYFTSSDLLYSYLWLYIWFGFIYLPWRFITNDPVYTILADETPLKQKIQFIATIHLLFVIANTTGYIIHNIHNTYG